MLIINYFGAPNSGKTTAAMDTTTALKKMHIEADYVPEPVKLAHYTQNQAMLKDELSLFAAKNHHFTALRNSGVKIAVTDGPLLTSIVYKPDGYFESFDALIVDVANSYESLNFYIPGVRKFSEVGRGEKNESEALTRGDAILDMLNDNNIDFHILSKELDIVEQVIAIINSNLALHKRSLSLG